MLVSQFKKSKKYAYSFNYVSTIFSRQNLVNVNHFYIPLDNKFLILTVATEETSGYKRYQRSVKINGLPVKVLGLGEEWKVMNIYFFVIVQINCVMLRILLGWRYG